MSRVSVAIVDGRLWSSATIDDRQTRRLRLNPRCTLYLDGPGFAWCALDVTATIIDGHEAPELNLRLFRVVHRLRDHEIAAFEPGLTDETFVERMRAERRLIYEFEGHRSYGEP